MEWREDGLCLAARRHGETAMIVEIFTRGQGRHLGVLPGGASRKHAAHLEPGNQLDAAWHARLDSHIGTWRIEPVKSRAGPLLSDRAALAGLASVAALLSFALPEREAHARLYDRTLAFLDALGLLPDWPEHYLKWELALLDDLGFGLDLRRCAVTGATEDLAFVSPRTARAVSRGAAGEWSDRLLPLPAILGGSGEGGLMDGLRLSGYFLEHRLAAAHGDRQLPPARARLIDRLAREDATR